MSRRKDTVSFREFGALLNVIQHVIPVDGKLLNDTELSGRVSMGIHTYGKVKVAKV